MPDTEPPGWITFSRHDLRRLTDAVRAVAASGDPGAYGHGVEVIVESPSLRLYERLFSRSTVSKGSVGRDRARIAVTDAHGHCGYPVHVRLDTTHGGAATRHVVRRPGWATSNTVGQAILMMKARAAGTDGYDAVELATGTVDALSDLHWREPVRGWRFRVDRAVLRR